MHFANKTERGAVMAALAHHDVEPMSPGIARLLTDERLSNACNPAPPISEIPLHVRVSELCDFTLCPSSLGTTVSFLLPAGISGNLIAGHMKSKYRAPYRDVYPRYRDQDFENRHHESYEIAKCARHYEFTLTDKLAGLESDKLEGYLYNNQLGLCPASILIIGALLFRDQKGFPENPSGPQGTTLVTGTEDDFGDLFQGKSVGSDSGWILTWGSHGDLLHYYHSLAPELVAVIKRTHSFLE